MRNSPVIELETLLKWTNKFKYTWGVTSISDSQWVRGCDLQTSSSQINNFQSMIFYKSLLFGFENSERLKNSGISKIETSFPTIVLLYFFEVQWFIILSFLFFSVSLKHCLHEAVSVGSPLHDPVQMTVVSFFSCSSHWIHKWTPCIVCLYWFLLFFILF